MNVPIMEMFRTTKSQADNFPFQLSKLLDKETTSLPTQLKLPNAL